MGQFVDIGVESYFYNDVVEYVIDGVVIIYGNYIVNFNFVVIREVRFIFRVNFFRFLYVFGYFIVSVGFRCV